MEEGDRPVVLVDGDQLVRELIDLELGVKKIPVVTHVMDEDFFHGLR